jgi:PAS domain S-box-containing protein
MLTNQTSEQRYHDLFEHMPICIYIADLSIIPVTILEVNQQAELLYGYLAVDLVGMPITHLVPKEAIPSLLTIVEQVQQGQTVKAETTNQRRDGTYFLVRLIAAPYLTDGNHMIITVEDITARVLSELHRVMPEFPRVKPLSKGEMAVLRLVAQGVENQDIAQLLNYSVYTVANLLRTIYEKLHVTNRTQAALYALRQGWATLDDTAV